MAFTRGYWKSEVNLYHEEWRSALSVTARKDDTPATGQAAFTNAAAGIPGPEGG